jgi:hypothetical protein
MRSVFILIVLFVASPAFARPPHGSPSGGSPFIGACPVTVGTLTLAATTPRATGISPFLVFFDATGTTDSATLGGANTTFQDVSYTWNFGDSSAVSGSGATWLYGSNPNVNSRNVATGAIAAHLYITAGSDTPYTATVTATDGTNTASCNVAVTAYDPSGSNGFPGTATICAFNSALGTGCPSGATQLTTSSVTTATAGMSGGTRVLLKCGDTFTGSTTTITGTKSTLGAYGSCPGAAITSGNQANYPQVSGTVNIDTLATDVRVSDLVINSGSNNAVAVRNNYIPPYTPTVQVTMWNLWSNATNQSYYVAQGTQIGYIQLVQIQQGVNQGTFVNFAENNCNNGSTAALCGLTSPTPANFVNIMYTAMMGGSYNGTGAPNNGQGIETVRVSACRMCVFSNNTIQNANNVGAVLKFHNGNTKNSSSGLVWTGQYTEYIEASDNYFTGTSGAQLVEITPQNAGDDERMRLIVLERNHFTGVDTGGGRQIWVSGENITLRDNVFDGAGTGALLAERWCPTGSPPTCSGSSANPYATQNVEFYNNTCTGGGDCVDMISNFAAPATAANNSFAQNNICYTGSCGSNTGTGNTISNNSTSTSANPGFVNASGTFGFISDYKPTANYAGATTVPVQYDGNLSSLNPYGVAWPPTWDLGAVHH